MLKEHLEAVRSKEKEAKAALKEAESLAEAIKDKAREQGERLLAETRAQAADLERSLLAKARRDAEENIELMRAENAKMVVALSVGAKKNLEKAVETVMRAFQKGI